MKALVTFMLGAVCGAVALFFFSAARSAPADVKPCPDRTSVAVVNDTTAGGATPDARPAASPADATSLPAAIEQVAQVEPAPADTASAPAQVLPPAPAPAMSASPIDLSSLAPSAVSDLLIPVVGVKPTELTDTFTQARGEGRVHDAIDIMAARGTPVVAANDGHVVKLFTSKPGGLTVYEFDPQDQVVYYYAHLDGYAPGLAEGQVLHRGDPVGFVGSTGNASADAPHLHFEVEVLGPEKQWWHATSINPYGRFAGQL